jgi:hypothetical protein
MLQQVPCTDTIAAGQLVVVGVGQLPSLLRGLPSGQMEVTGGQSLPRQAGSTKKHWPLINLAPAGHCGPPQMPAASASGVQHVPFDDTVPAGQACAVGVSPLTQDTLSDGKPLLTGAAVPSATQFV